MKRGYVLAGAAAALALLAIFIARPAAQPPHTAEIAQAAHAPSAAGMRFFSTLGDTDPGPSTEITLTDTQSLIADSALRSVMDYYLLDRGDDGRLQALRTHLQRRLPPAAAQEAVQLAEAYAGYLVLHDQLLAAQNFINAEDTGRLASWQQQRHQLRMRLMGERVTEEWFGTEEAYLAQALEEARQPQVNAPTSEDEALHRQHMQQVLRDAIGKAAASQRFYAPALGSN
ncbi:hypothetical protein [Duganella sp.]|uniref:hypothetical protein n=1 Tax=Duganella sp. TaxID=1904440 RepID=UPI0031E25319